jgi:hypothetical protein
MRWEKALQDEDVEVPHFVYFWRLVEVVRGCAPKDVGSGVLAKQKAGT